MNRYEDHGKDEENHQAKMHDSMGCTCFLFPSTKHIRMKERSSAFFPRRIVSAPHQRVEVEMKYASAKNTTIRPSTFR